MQFAPEGYGWNVKINGAVRSRFLDLSLAALVIKPYHVQE
jgi:hypothetical protein